MLNVDFVQTVITCLTVLLAAVLWYNVSIYSYWKRKDVPGPQPVPIFGNFLDIVLYTNSVTEKYRDLYQTWKHEPFIGLYHGSCPGLLINDPTLIRQIFIKDFNTFIDRPFVTNEDVDPLTGHIFFYDSHRWRGLRNNLSPVFTSAKLRQLYNLLCKCADNFEECVNNLVAKGEPIECRDITAKYATDVVGSCVFGVDMHALSREDSAFRNIGRKAFIPAFSNSWKRVVRDVLPGLFKLLKLRTFSPEITDFFTGSVVEIVDHRKKSGGVRKDLIDLLIDIQANPKKINFEMTDDRLAAETFVFFLAGFETSSATISFALYELAQNQDIQDKLRAEIQDTLETHNGQLPYEGIKDLKYLDKVFRETLRKHSPVSVLTRKAVKDYLIPGTKVHIPAGTSVHIPVSGIHYDPNYYPDPEVFNPERFEDEAIKKRPSMTWLPFGEGPRNCIGARFAQYQTKMGIIKVLKNHKVSISPKTKIPYVVDRHTFLLTPVGGMHLNFTKIV